jgi:hypothetical protein
MNKIYNQKYLFGFNRVFSTKMQFHLIDCNFILYKNTT